MVMSDGRDERQILALAVSSLTSCRPVASLLTTGGDLRAPDGCVLDWPELATLWVPRTVSRSLISAFATRRPRSHGSQAARQDLPPFDSRT